MRQPSHTRELLAEKRESILRVAAAYGARNVRVFGSVVRGEDRPGSDVDLLVDFDPGVTLLQHAGLKVELEDLLGRSVDVVPAKMLHEHLRERVLGEAVPL